eukprot:scaffold2.g7294.t1
MKPPLLVFCALALATAAAPLPTLPVQLTAAPARVAETPCEFCEQIVTSVTDYLADNDTQALLVQYIDQTICSQLSPSLVDACHEEASVLVASAAAAVKEAATPGDVCQLVGACPPSLSLDHPWVAVVGLSQRAARKLGGPLECPFCRMAVFTLIGRLQDPTARAKIEADMHAGCDTLAPAQQPKCHQDVENFFRALDNLMNDIDPLSVCKIAEFCAADPGVAAARPAALDQLQGLAAQLRHTSSGPGAAAASNRLQDFKAQCIQYVELYAPLVLNMAITYLQPEPLCARLGYCPAPPPPAQPVLAVA